MFGCFVVFHFVFFSTDKIGIVRRSRDRETAARVELEAALLARSRAEESECSVRQFGMNLSLLCVKMCVFFFVSGAKNARRVHECSSARRVCAA